MAGMLAVASACGVNKAEVLRELGLDQAFLDAPESLIPVGQYYKLTNLVGQKSIEADIGLFFGRMSYLENMHLNIYMASASDSLREWLNMMPSVKALFGDIGEIRVKSNADSFALQWHPWHSANLERCVVTDSVICSTVLQMNSYCLLPVVPRKVELSYDKPRNLDVLRLMLGENLIFNQPHSAVHYDRKVLDFPLAHVSTRIYNAVAEEFAKMFSPDASQSDPFSLALHAAIRAELPKGDCSIELIARTLNVSTRTLQRRLTERDTNFQQLLQSIKSTLAKKYLRDDQLSILQIALLLGYGDHSSFSAAFKSWNAMSPSEYRNGNTS